MNVNNKQILIDAIYGKGFPSIRMADEMTKRGLAYFNGNQWNESWAWNKDALAKLDEAELIKLYGSLYD